MRGQWEKYHVFLLQKTDAGGVYETIRCVTYETILFLLRRMGSMGFRQSWREYIRQKVSASMYSPKVYTRLCYLVAERREEAGVEA